MLFLFAATRIGRGESNVRRPVLMFGFGYLLVWVGFSAVATLMQWMLHQTTMMSAAMVISNRYVSGRILIAAGAYQWTPWKGACLTQCRSPMGFLITNWRDGPLGAFRMGLGHGAYCLGCCWALMCVLFVVGVMNLLWVATLAGFVLLEKIGPVGAAVARVAGAAMVLAGILVIAAKM